MQGPNQSYTPYTKFRGPGGMGPAGGPEELIGGPGSLQGAQGACRGAKKRMKIKIKIKKRKEKKKRKKGKGKEKNMTTLQEFLKGRLGAHGPLRRPSPI